MDNAKAVGHGRNSGESQCPMGNIKIQGNNSYYFPKPQGGYGQIQTAQAGCRNTNDKPYNHSYHAASQNTQRHRQIILCRKDCRSVGTKAHEPCIAQRQQSCTQCHIYSHCKNNINADKYYYLQDIPV